MKKVVNIILFEDFETLDVFGPVEILGRMEDDFELHFYSERGGAVKSAQQVAVFTDSFDSMIVENSVLFIPGGSGTRTLVRNESYIRVLKTFAEKADYVLTVCTGSILLSKTGLLDGKKAASNKRVFSWTARESPDVEWIKKARWVKDGTIYTSSGVSAGMDMTLGFVSDLFGYEKAKQQSNLIEYVWNEDSGRDPFSELYE